ncbi:MAG: hypothetical protein E7357_06265 [Clostridiales bacterium]|nr:hypothetical protein [Clostridiales bacterium]
MQLEMSDILAIFNRIQALEDKVSMLETRIVGFDDQKLRSNRPAFPVNEVGEKYKGLAEYLYEKWDKKIVLTYKEIESILGFTLPETARKFPQSYWANTETHSYAKGSWLAVGYKAKWIGEQKVAFERNLY